MPFNTLTVACFTAPTIVSTFFSHFCSCTSRPRGGGDGDAFELSYEEGVALIRRFLTHASHHTVEELQAFTAMYVPTPTWVRTENVEVPAEHMQLAAEVVQTQLGEKARGKWWRWRERELTGEWIWVRDKWWGARNSVLDGEEGEMKTMLYIHGGAYFFGSVDEHRYQLQRHARKLGVRVFAPRYRLAPQFPFPCAIYDVLACYLYLLTLQPASSIIIAGDSAGAGMALSILCILRDQGLALPAGAVLISPWADLCHSFPSVIDDNSRDYIPAHGFLHRPSEAWPPPKQRRAREEGLASATDPGSVPLQEITINSCERITIDGVDIEIQDQIQLYTTNDMLTHPLVSPVNQKSLASLCPTLVLTGGGEVLRDEQVYISHKAAFPTIFGDPGDPRPPTKVWLQVFSNACHVLPTLAWTKPAKMVGDTISAFATQVWTAPETLDAFRFEHVSLANGTQMRDPLKPSDFPPTERIGVITPEPVKRWIEAKRKWDAKYVAKPVRKQQRDEDEDEDEDEEGVPPSAAYRRRKRERPEGRKGERVSEGEMKKEQGWGMSIWAGWSAKSDKNMVKKEDKAEARGECEILEGG